MMELLVVAVVISCISKVKRAQFVVCNLTTKELKFLPPPDFQPPPHSGFLVATGLGYDAESKDYKLIRNYVQYLNGEADEYGNPSDLGSETHFEVYSFKDESWKKIPDPDVSTINTAAVSVGETGRCYWRGVLDFKYFLGGSSDSNAMRVNVLSFDFATESFGHFPLPDNSFGAEASYKLVECRGSLGALVYSGHNVEIYVRGENSWENIYRACIPRLETPLFLKDDRFLFVEARGRRRDGHGGLSCLAVCDLDEEKLEELRVRLVQVYGYHTSDIRYGYQISGYGYEIDI